MSSLATRVLASRLLEGLVRFWTATWKRRLLDGCLSYWHLSDSSVRVWRAPFRISTTFHRLSATLHQLLYCMVIINSSEIAEKLCRDITCINDQSIMLHVVRAVWAHSRAHFTIARSIDYHKSKTRVKSPTFFSSGNYRSPRFAFQHQHFS